MSCGTCYQAAAQQLGSAAGTPGGQIYGVTDTGQPYTVRAMLSDNRLASLQRDAQRVLGQIPAPHRDPIERYAAGGRGEAETLEPPMPELRKLAELWLSLRAGEAAEIWIEGHGVSYANVAPLADIRWGATK